MKKENDSTSFVSDLFNCLTSIVKFIFDIFFKFIEIIVKSIRGFIYCFLKNPSILKYLGFLFSIIIGVIVVIFGAKQWGIITTCIGGFIPLCYLSTFSSYLDKYNSKVKMLRKIITEQIEDEDLEIFIDQVEKSKQFKSLMKDNNKKIDFIVGGKKLTFLNE